MEKKKLLELAKQLNKLEDEEGNLLVSKKVKVVAVNEETLISSFLESCNSIDESKEELLPDEITEAYNELVALEGEKTTDQNKDEKENSKESIVNKSNKENKNKSENAKISKKEDKIIGKDQNKKNDVSKKEQHGKKHVSKEINIVDLFGVREGTGAFLFVESVIDFPGTMSEICKRDWNKKHSTYYDFFKKMESKGLMKKDEKGIISAV